MPATAKILHNSLWQHNLKPTPRILSYKASISTSITSFAMKFSILKAAALAALASAHMQMSYPPPYRSKFNELAEQVDNDMIAPLSPSGSNFPCKGYLIDVGSPAGGSTATWAAGSQQKMTIEGGADHNGGSCQASISVDGGNTFKVIHSYIGKCPISGGADFPFTVPGDTPTGDQIFAWTWFNKVGVREMYMNCATVTITGGGGSASIPFNSRPNILRANTGNGCTNRETVDLDFPDPGPDVTNVSENKEPPTGNCGSEGPKGGNGSAPPLVPPPGGGSGSAPLPPAGPGNGAPGTPPPAPGTPPPANNPPAVPPIPGLTQDSAGSCGGQFTCLNSIHGGCCSSFGFCGSTPGHCDISNGCQPQFGSCTGWNNNRFVSGAPNATATSSFLDGPASLQPSSSSTGRVSVTPFLPIESSPSTTTAGFVVSPIGGKKVVTKTNTIFSTVSVTPGATTVGTDDTTTSFETTVIFVTSTPGAASTVTGAAAADASVDAPVAGGDYRRHEDLNHATPTFLTYPPPAGFKTGLAGPTSFQTKGVYTRHSYKSSSPSTSTKTQFVTLNATNSTPGVFTVRPTGARFRFRNGTGEARNMTRYAFPRPKKFEG